MITRGLKSLSWLRRELMKFPARSNCAVLEIRGKSRFRGAIVAHVVSGEANELWKKRSDEEDVCTVDIWEAKSSRMVSLIVCGFDTSRCLERRWPIARY